MAIQDTGPIDPGHPQAASGGGPIRDALVNALYSSLGQSPALKGFLTEMCRLLDCDVAGLVIGTPTMGQTVKISDASADRQALAAGILERSDLSLADDSVSIVHQPSASGEAILLSISDERIKVGQLVLCRPAGEPFGDDIVAMLLSLHDSIKLAIRIFLRISRAERRRNALDVALETSGVGFILVDQKGAVLMTNAVADRLLAQADGLRLSHGHIHAEYAAENTLLLAEIRRHALAQSAVSDFAIYTPAAVSRQRHSYPLTILVRPGPAFHPLPEPLMRTAMIILRDPNDAPPVPGAILARLFGLTPAEAMLASELTRGSTLEQAAVTLGVARNTVRSQLQRIFEKTRAKRQGELIRLLLSSVAASIHSPEDLG